MVSQARILRKAKGSRCLYILGLFVFCSCDDEPCAWQNLIFVMPMSVEPSDSIVQLGDTLWISAAIDDSLYEYHTKKRYRLVDFNFGQTSIGVTRLVDKNQDLAGQRSAASAFQVVIELGTITYLGSTFIDFKFLYDQEKHKYRLRMGFVAKRTGVYCFAPLPPVDLPYMGVVDLGKAENGATITPVYRALFFPINEGNNNFELFKEHCFDSSALNPANYVDNNYIRYGTFTFRVVE